MGRKRQRQASSVDEEDRWKNSLLWHGNSDTGISIEMVGFESPAGTIFARIIMAEQNASIETFDIKISLEKILKVIISQIKNSSHCVNTDAQELCRLGSVWILPLPDEKHPQNSPKFRREFNAEFIVNYKATIRLHSRPSRFPAFENVCIVARNDELGFVLVNKPGGCPSHATVDNAIENALSQVQTLLGCSYATLPQRLDTETFGLLLVATRPEFAAYASRLLEQKSKKGTTLNAITKRYRCLVVIPNDQVYKQLKQFESSGETVSHYLDARSPAPKQFCDELPLEEGNNSQWQICNLKILNVSNRYHVAHGSESILDGDFSYSMAVKLHVASATHVAQVEIELLTGRTHQIRGQMSALKAPIVGDPLYGGGGSIRGDSGERMVNQMALQCCAMEFVRPIMNGIRSKPSGEKCRFQLDVAWWTEHL